MSSQARKVTPKNTPEHVARCKAKAKFLKRSWLIEDRWKIMQAQKAYEKAKAKRERDAL